MKNNLYIIRSYIEVKPSIISKLLNVRVDAYLSYEVGTNSIPKVIIKMLSRMYNLSEQYIIGDKDIKNEHIEKLKEIKMAYGRMKENMLFKNLCGDDSKRINYREINKIKKTIKSDIEQGNK